MQILEEDQLEQAVSVNTVDREVIEIVLLGVKEAISQISPTDTLKQSLANKLGVYLDSQLKKSNITFSNKSGLLIYLSEHFEVVQDIIKACQDARENFGKDIPMQLEFTKERDTSGASSLSLSLLLPEYSEKQYESIKAFSKPYTSDLMKHGVLFYITDEYLE